MSNLKQYNEFIESTLTVKTDLPHLKVDEALDLLNSPQTLNKKFSPLNNVLGIIEGKYFSINEASGNGIWYSKEFWESVLSRPDVQQRLAKGMLGTIEHPRDETDDTRPQYYSHVVKKLWIDYNKNEGWGKSYILNTPMGKILAVLGSATDEKGNPLVQYGVSVRAWGMPAGTHNGFEALDPKSYYMESFDVVLNPGIKTALPKFEIIKTFNESVKLLCDDNVCVPAFESLGKRSYALELLIKMESIIGGK